MITVRYTGRRAAILAGSYIYEGETRAVHPAQLAEAERAHPGRFVVEDGVWEAEPAAIAQGAAAGDPPAVEQAAGKPESAPPARLVAPQARPPHGRQPKIRR